MGKFNCNLLRKNPEVCAVKVLFDFLQERDEKILDPVDITNFREFIALPDNLSSQKVWLWNQISDPNLGIHDCLELKETDSAIFRWVLIGSKVVSIEDLFEKEKVNSSIQTSGKLISFDEADSEDVDGDEFDFTDEEINFDPECEEVFQADCQDVVFEDEENFLYSRVELWDVMERVCHSQKQFVNYFVAEGNYDGYGGVHICLTPYNDLTSVEALKILFGEENFQKALDSSDPDSPVLFDEEEILFSEVSEEKKKICNHLFLEHFQKSFQVLETVN
ncbi:hypothetical protein K9M48_05550 [Candidatus Gracilibacteria bacterium]|nr:hypothetical protein [Candidatus Gracilibacteria bacterium]